jgi:hypothetical protein
MLLRPLGDYPRWSPRISKCPHQPDGFGRVRDVALLPGSALLLNPLLKPPSQLLLELGCLAEETDDEDQAGAWRVTDRGEDGWRVDTAEMRQPPTGVASRE